MNITNMIESLEIFKKYTDEASEALGLSPMEVDYGMIGVHLDSTIIAESDVARLESLGWKIIVERRLNDPRFHFLHDYSPTSELCNYSCYYHFF